jgi:hypothetical protein
MCAMSISVWALGLFQLAAPVTEQSSHSTCCCKNLQASADTSGNVISHPSAQAGHSWAYRLYTMCHSTSEGHLLLYQSASNEWHQRLRPRMQTPILEAFNKLAEVPLTQPARPRRYFSSLRRRRAPRVRGCSAHLSDSASNSISLAPQFTPKQRNLYSALLPGDIQPVSG